MSKETEKVRRWRERMKAEGKQAITLWLNRDAIERLNTLAAEAKVTASEFIDQTVTVTQPKVTDTTAKVTAMVTDTKAEVTDAIRKDRALTAEMVAAIREVVREEVERALYQVIKPRVTVTKPKVTDTKAGVTDTTAKVTDTVTDTTRKNRSQTAEKLANAAMTLREQGLNWAEIARRWNAEGIPTLTGRGQWHDGNVARLVKNTARPGPA